MFAFMYSIYDTYICIHVYICICVCVCNMRAFRNQKRELYPMNLELQVAVKGPLLVL